MTVWPFNRKKKQDSTLPPDVQEYYDAGQKQRTGVAWLLALATLVVTVILAMALFFGGRWIYQKLSGNDDDASKEQTAQQADNQDQASQPPAETDESATNDQQSSSTNTDQQPTTGETPTTGSNGEEIPSTGPGPGGLQ